MAYKLEEYVIAFIDILGASEKIKEDSEKSLNIVHTVYENALISCEKLYDNEYIKELKPLIRIWSDNIVIAVPIKQNNDFAAFTSIAILSGLIQYEFLHYRYLVRGGIAIGDFFVDETMVWGKALLDAYYIESNVSIYPRIVIHPEIVGKLNLATNKYRQKWIKQDSDGLFFVDYMQEIGFDKNFMDILVYRINECEKLMDEAVDMKSKQKVLWHNTYLNSKMDDYSTKYSDLLSREIKKLESLTEEIEKNGIC